MYYYSPYLMHYGVKGMKWGVRRSIQDWGNDVNRFASDVSQRSISDVSQRVIRDTKRDASRPVQAWKQRRATTNAHNRAIKKRWQQQKRSGVKGSAEYNAARSARRRNLAGRAVAFTTGFGKSDQGRYYQHRQAGMTKTEAALRVVGKRTVRHLAVDAVVNVGKVAVGGYLRRQF